MLTSHDYSILALDAYNFDYNSNLIDGISSVVSSADLIGSTASGFFAKAYEIGGKIVISFRGTDGINDVPDWLSGAGDPHTAQMLEAAKFVRAVIDNVNLFGSTPIDPSQISFTGHSLGGGLAGAMASVFGASATLFDNMPFEDAAVNIVTNLRTKLLELGEPGFSMEPEFAEFYTHIYGEDFENIDPNTLVDPGIDGIKIFSIVGEIIEAFRARSNIPESRNVRLELGETDSHNPLDVLDAVDRHSMGLLSLLLSEDGGKNPQNEWYSVGQFVLPDLFEPEIAQDSGFIGSNPEDELISALAYSASKTSTPGQFGNIAANVLFRDMDDLSEIYKFSAFGITARPVGVNLTKQEWDADVTGGISSAVIAYAGWLAKNGALNTINSNAAGGIVSENFLESGVAFDIDFSEEKWTLNGEKPTQISGRQEIISSLTSIVGADAEAIFKNIVSTLAGEDYPQEQLQDPYALVEHFVFAANNGGGYVGNAVGQLGEQWTVFVGTPFDDQIDGKSSSDIIFGSGSNNVGDTINGNGGNDLIFGTKLADQLTGGDGVEVLVGGEGDDVLDAGPDDGHKSYLFGGAGEDQFLNYDRPDVRIMAGEGGEDFVLKGEHSTWVSTEGDVTVQLADHGGGQTVIWPTGLSFLSQRFKLNGNIVPTIAFVEVEGLTEAEFAAGNFAFGGGADVVFVNFRANLDEIFVNGELLEFGTPSYQPLIEVNDHDGERSYAIYGLVNENGDRFEVDIQPPEPFAPPAVQVTQPPEPFATPPVRVTMLQSSSLEPLVNIGYFYQGAGGLVFDTSNSGYEIVNYYGTEVGGPVKSVDGDFIPPPMPTESVLQLHHDLKHPFFYEDAGTPESGSSGNDHMQGSEEDDTFYPGDGDDTVEGNGGDDVIIAGTGRGDDIYYGGEGNDWVIYPSTNQGIVVDLGQSSATGLEIDNDTLFGIENVEGGSGADIISGNQDANILVGGDGDDLLQGRGGADTLLGGAGFDSATYESSASGVNINLFTGIGLGGDAEGDQLQSIEGLKGSNFADNLRAGAKSSKIEGLGGDDQLYGSGASDQLFGGDGDDVILGGDGDDIIVGGDGADTMDGGKGYDIASYQDAAAGVYLHFGDLSQSSGDAAGDTFINFEAGRGSAFDDEIIVVHDNLTIWAGAGNDLVTSVGHDGIVYGEAGADTLHGGSFNDNLYGGSGDDEVFGYGGDDRIYLGDGDDYAIGGDGQDVIEGAAGVDTIHAGDGNDSISGNAGNDILHGNNGDDKIFGGTGDDWLVGGADDDTFVFKQNEGWDSIADFQTHSGTSAGDLIELHDQSVTTFVDLIANATDWNGNSYINLDNGAGITLYGVTLSELTQDDFAFV